MRGSCTGRLVRGLAFATAFAAFATSGCAKESKAPLAKSASVARRIKTALSRPYIALRANELPAGSQYDMIPLDLWAPFRWELTFGVFDPERANGLDDAFFGTSLDTRGAVDHHYYGIYATVQAGGISVFAESDVGFPGGGAFFAGAKRIEAVVEADDATITFYARDADVGGGYAELGSLPFTGQEDPLTPGIEVGGLEGRAEIGYAHLRVVSNSPAPTPVGPQHAALNALIEALGPLAEARYALTEAPHETALAIAHLDLALTRLAAATKSIEAIPEAVERKSPRARALATVTKLSGRLTAARENLAQRGRSAATKVNRGLGGRFLDLVRAADAILPDDVRGTLPGNRRSL